jgi:threonine dehydratase
VYPDAAGPSVADLPEVPVDIWTVTAAAAFTALATGLGALPFRYFSPDERRWNAIAAVLVPRGASVRAAAGWSVSRSAPCCRQGSGSRRARWCGWSSSRIYALAVRSVAAPTRTDVEAAERRIRPYLPPTPLAAGLKLETLQPTGSFKVRGALNALLQLDGEPVVTASAGNFGLAVAWAAGRLGVDATVVVAESASPAKIAALRRFPVTLVIHGADYDGAEQHALSLGGRYVSPYNDTAVIAGQGTIALELRDAQTIVVPVGGGGLASGIRLATDATVIGVVPASFPAMPAALAAGRVVEIDGDWTIADALHGNIEPGSVTVDLLRGVEIVEVTEQEIEAAMRFLAHEHGLVTEGAGATATAALLAGKAQGDVAIVTGRNVTAESFARVLQGGAGG